MTALYLASRWGRREELRRYAAHAISLGHTVTSRWLFEHEAETNLVKYALEDWRDVERGDGIVLFTEAPDAPGRARGGRHVEFGIALALEKELHIVGPKENVFHHLVLVSHWGDWEEFAAANLAPRKSA